MSSESREILAMQLALAEAAKFRGATSPNPPVGAVITRACGKVLGIGAHAKAGGPHAEVLAIQSCNGAIREAHALVVTLEPCNHTGRTAPCTDAILQTPIRRIVIGTLDPNPMVNGRGVERLARAGFQITLGVLEKECQELIAPFSHRQTKGRPWITVKTAFHADGSMIPDNGEKTFTPARSLTLAHALRKRADAILTGSGTILSDQPSFTVRRVEDHPGKSRALAVLDRRGRVPEYYYSEALARGLRPKRYSDIDRALEDLAAQDVLEVLVEAGPQLSASILESDRWDEHWIFWEDGRTERRLREPK